MLKEYAVAVTGGLLASSCCLVQLVLNAFSIGCVGLNTVFEPYRRYFFWLALLGLAASFWRHILLPWWTGRCCTLEEDTRRKKKPNAHRPTATRHRPQWLSFDDALLFTDERIIAVIDEAKFKAAVLRREKVTEAGIH